MALGDLWNRTLVYFGIAEEDDWDDDAAVEEELERSYEERRANVRRLSPRRRPGSDFDDIFSEEAPRAVPIRGGRNGAPPPQQQNGHRTEEKHLCCVHDHPTFLCE